MKRSYDWVRKYLQQRKNDLVYYLTLFGVVLFRSIPMALAIRLGGLIGISAYYLLASERRKALGHIEIALGNERTGRERRRIVKASFRNLGKNAAEVLHLSEIRSEFDTYVSVDGQDHLDLAMSQGKGVLWLTAHIGNWELLASYWAARGYPLRVIARQVYDERLNKLLMDIRNQAGVPTILRDSPRSGREILQALRRKDVLAMLIDQDSKVKGVMVDFFGKKANTPAGAAIIAMKRSVPVIAGFINRTEEGGHRIKIYPPIEIVPCSDYYKGIEENTQRFTKIIEMHIRQFPEDWVWIHRRWRRQTPYLPVVSSERDL